MSLPLRKCNTNVTNTPATQAPTSVKRRDRVFYKLKSNKTKNFSWTTQAYNRFDVIEDKFNKWKYGGKYETELQPVIIPPEIANHKVKVGEQFQKKVGTSITPALKKLEIDTESTYNSSDIVHKDQKRACGRTYGLLEQQPVPYEQGCVDEHLIPPVSQESLVGIYEESNTSCNIPLLAYVEKMFETLDSTESGRRYVNTNAEHRTFLDEKEVHLSQGLSPQSKKRIDTKPFNNLKYHVFDSARNRSSPNLNRSSPACIDLISSTIQTKQILDDFDTNIQKENKPGEDAFDQFKFGEDRGDSKSIGTTSKMEFTLWDKKKLYCLRNHNGEGTGYFMTDDTCEYIINRDRPSSTPSIYNYDLSPNRVIPYLDPSNNSHFQILSDLTCKSVSSKKNLETQNFKSYVSLARRYFEEDMLSHTLSDLSGYFGLLVDGSCTLGHNSGEARETGPVPDVTVTFNRSLSILQNCTNNQSCPENLYSINQPDSVQSAISNFELSLLHKFLELETSNYQDYDEVWTSKVDDFLHQLKIFWGNRVPNVCLDFKEKCHDMKGLKLKIRIKNIINTIKIEHLSHSYKGRAVKREILNLRDFVGDCISSIKLPFKVSPEYLNELREKRWIYMYRYMVPEKCQPETWSTVYQLMMYNPLFTEPTRPRIGDFKWPSWNKVSRYKQHDEKWVRCFDVMNNTDSY